MWTRIVEESIAFVTITGKMSFREFRELLILLYGDNIVQMKNFYCFTIPSKQKGPNFLMETTSNSIWILRTPPNAKQMDSLEIYMDQLVSSFVTSNYSFK